MAMEWTQAGVTVVAVAASLFLVSAFAVTLRLISRGRILHILGPTDWFMVLTLVRHDASASLENPTVRMLTTYFVPFQLFAFATTIAVGNRTFIVPLSLGDTLYSSLQNSQMAWTNHDTDPCCDQLPPMGWATTSRTSLRMRSARSSWLVSYHLPSLLPLTDDACVLSRPCMWP